MPGELQQEESQQDEPQPSGAEQRESEEAGPYRRDYAEPTVERRQAEVAHRGAQDRPFAQPQPETGPAAPAPTGSTPAAPRRGSTVREPVPTSFSFGGEFSAPEPTPRGVEPERPAPAESTESEDAGRPRRAGWWSRRVLGKG